MMLKNLTWVIFILHFKVYLLLNSCEKQTTCHDCIREPSRCVWCAHNNLTGIRCKLPNTYDTTWCPEELQNPDSFRTTSDQYNRDFCADHGNVIQIKPQRYKLKLRVGEPMNFTFSFKGAKDYPVDLYFLLDASKNMESIKNTTATQSVNIYKTMKRMTNDVYLGMGKFIDKNALPFARKVNSEMTYSFRHQLKLTTDFMEFQNTVSNMLFGANRDIQEGGLDAIAQIIVCKDVIGWRNESRKIIVYLTNAPYHGAGDGKAAGITDPYDGKCYTENGVYTKETDMDYPSVGMINKLAAQNNVIILFLIEDTYDYVYQDLSTAISGSKVKSYNKDSIADNDSIVDILKDIYQKITNTVKLKVNVKVGNRKNIKISFDPDCTLQNNNKICEAKNEEEQTFTGTVKVLEYDEFDNYTLEVGIEGISEKLTLDIDIIKDCECEKIGPKTKYCNGETQQCGICKCGDTRYGDRCACVRNENNRYNDNFTCIAEGTNETCSGRGSCFCGTCKCNKGHEGKYCECNEDDCPRNANDKFCNGHGKCVCGKCECEDGWIGKECHCPLSEADCKGPNDQICNNRGICKCGQCQCPDLPKWDSRYDRQDEFCNISPCPQCHSFQCRILDTCALLLWYKQECRDDRIRPKWIRNLTDEYLNSTVWNVCPDIKVDVGCYTRYVYRYNDDVYGIEILVSENKDCVKSYLLFGGICLISMIVIGILTLIGWKLLTEARDKREFQSFVKQHKEDASERSLNPLYEPAVTIFNNPSFGKMS